MLKLLATPKDVNSFGDVYAGWLINQLDQAAELVAANQARGRCATVSVSQLDFTSPIPLGAEVEVFCESVNVRHSSMTIALEAWYSILGNSERVKITEGEWVMVAICDQGHIRAISN